MIPHTNCWWLTYNRPAIIILDSMNVPRQAAIARLREWLIHEAKVKRGLEISKAEIKGCSAKVRYLPTSRGQVIY